MKTKTFDCVKMKDEAQQRIRKTLSRLDERQQLEYFKKLHDELIERQKTLRDKRKKRGRESF